MNIALKKKHGEASLYLKTMSEDTHADDGSEETNDSPTITQQYSFSVGKDGEIDGQIEPAEKNVETSLGTFGADVDHRERDSRIDQPEASSFGVDDRKTVTRGDGGEQHALFADTDDDQQTLTGERAASQCLFESDEQDDDRTEKPADASDELTPRAVADGGQPVENDDSAEQTDGNEDVMVAIPRLKLASVADYVAYERNAVERHAGKGPMTEKLTQYVEECRRALSVLDDTDDNAHISRVVAAGASDELEQSAERHYGEVEQELRELVGVLRQALDEQRPSDGFEDDHNDEDDEPTDTDAQDDDRTEEPDESADGNEDTTFDAEAGTVTEAWEGVFITAQWGYNQTNTELAQIVEVSESGKTVLARLVKTERVGHGRTSEQLRPTAEQIGDEFRLHVRDGIDGDPRFRGSYPLGPDGDMNEATRRDSFYPFDNDPENSVYRTATGYGH